MTIGTNRGWIAAAALLVGSLNACSKGGVGDGSATAPRGFKGTFAGSVSALRDGEEVELVVSASLDESGTLDGSLTVGDGSVLRLSGVVDGETATVEVEGTLGDCVLRLEGVLSLLDGSLLSVNVAGENCESRPISITGTLDRRELRLNGELLSVERIEEIERELGIRLTWALLDEIRVAAIEQTFGTRVDAGHYWYDRASGLWGLHGLFALGRIPAGLDIAGPLPEDASGGATDVLVNGRRIHPVELRYLETLLGAIAPGRYFLEADGTYGVEGGPALGDLDGGGETAGGGTRGDGRSVFGHSLTGSVIGGGGVVGFIDGSTGVTCGPDGGCVF